MAYTTHDIRNIGLIGPTGAGKTMLLEALLLQAGQLRSKGNIERGTTVSDFNPQEKRLQHSLESTLASFDWNGTHINLLDTPGYPDFLGRSLAALEAVEAAAVVVDAVAGVDAVTRRLMEFAQQRGLCRIVIVNKIDSREGKPEAVFQQLQESFGRECLPLNLPAKNRQGVVDCFFRASQTVTEFSSAKVAHTHIVDQVIDVDETLMAAYLEQGTNLPPEQLHDAFEKALREGHLVPVCFTSAESNAGIPELLELIARLMPNPTEGNPPPFKRRGERGESPVLVSPDPTKHVIAHVFKVAVDPYVGKQGLLRVYQGTLTPGAQLFLGNSRKPIKVAHLSRVFGKDMTEMARAVPGDICAIAKVEELHFDAVLHDSHDEDHYYLQSVEFPPPMLGLAIEPERRGDEQRLSDALHKLSVEDPCVRIEHHATLNETVIYAMGDLHLRVLIERMSERHGVQVKTRPPRIPYRETITRSAQGHHRHKKQTGGAGQFGEVFLRVEPLDRGMGFEFVDEVVGGAIPNQFIPAVEKGVRQVLTEGVIAGYPVQDVRVTLLDGKYHAVDSKEVAFVSAGRKAFIEALRQAAPIVLEPIVRVEVTVPVRAIGDVTGDLASKRGRVSATSAGANSATVIALVPLAELSDYQSRLKSMTGGDGTFRMQLSHYDPVAAHKQQELILAWKPRSVED